MFQQRLARANGDIGNLVVACGPLVIITRAANKIASSTSWVTQICCDGARPDFHGTSCSSQQGQVSGIWFIQQQ
jgi:hypothetical protein